MTSQFSPKVSEILAFSREEATRLASRSVGPEHLLLGILRGNDGPVSELFSRQDINIQAIRAELEERVRDYTQNEPIITSELVLNEKASNILKLAVLEAVYNIRRWLMCNICCWLYCTIEWIMVLNLYLKRMI